MNSERRLLIVVVGGIGVAFSLAVGLGLALGRDVTVPLILMLLWVVTVVGYCIEKIVKANR